MNAARRLRITRCTLAIVSICLLASTTACVSPPARDTPANAAEQAGPLTLILVWGTTDTPLPSHAANVLGGSPVSFPVKPTTAFLSHAHHLSARTVPPDAGTLSNEFADWTYRIGAGSDSHHEIELSMTIRTATGSDSTRTTLDVAIGQWQYVGGSSDHQMLTRTDGQSSDHSSYRYQFICVADARGCSPPAP